MNSNFTKKLNFQIHETRVGIQKINSLKLDTFGMVITSFSMEDKNKYLAFFRRLSY